MAKSKGVSGFPMVEVKNVSLSKVTTLKDKCEISIKLVLDSSEAVQLASFAHRGAHLKIRLTEFDPELPLPAGD